jgi:hypothetical protein
VAATEQVHGMPTFLGRSLVAGLGLRLNDAFKPIMAIDRRRFRRHGFEWALARLERPGPALLARASVLPVSIFEIFVHHEDVRRPNNIDRADPMPDLVGSIEWLLRYHRRPLANRGVRIVLSGGLELRGGGDADVMTVSGDPGEVLLWLAGRNGEVSISSDCGSSATRPQLGV